MRSAKELSLRPILVSLSLLGGACLFAAAPSCAIENLIDAGKNCSSACANLNKCGLLQTSDCGAYCAGLESSATFAGCTSQFAAQNSCGAANAECTAASAEMCAPETKAMTQCIKNYCDNNPGGQGCPLSGDGGVEGGS